MNEERARRILGEAIKEDNSLFDIGSYLRYQPPEWDNKACLDGDFSADELEAIAWWMKNKLQG